MTVQPVAIIGSACRFPGETDSAAKLWQLLENPKDVLSSFPPDRLNLQSFYHKNGEYHGSTDVQNKGYLLSEDIRHFDASFFRISPSEAAAMDPQQRILLETAYEALESAGCKLDQLQGSLTSVWAGLMNGDFADIQARDLETLPTQHATGTHRSILSNRISYFFDLQGPSMTIDTACSSSLVALHQAALSLKSGESDMAVVAGANLILDPALYVAESKLHMLSPESRSRMWDKGANGYARGEGFAVIVLQRVNDAVRDRNNIECVIRGSAVNSDGRGKGGITMPSAGAQTALIRKAYKDAGLDVRNDRCQYFEAHGTGTQAGDPVEAQAIRDAFFPPGQSRDSQSPPGKLAVGSIKTIIGHLEGAAGLAGVLKASLAIQNRTLPPNMHFSELNPTVAPFYDNLEILTQPRPWPETRPGEPLRASVNSFGFGGTNAHIILESYENGREQAADAPAQDERFLGPLVFSANTRDSLLRSINAHAEHLRANKTINLADLAWTLQSRRTHFSNSRAAFAGATREKLISNMDAFVAAPTGADDRQGAPPVRFEDGQGPALLGIFTGQGAQWASMGRNLILHNRLFRETVEQCETSLADLGPDAPKWSLKEEMMKDETSSRIGEAALSQPLCTAVQVGLVNVLRASGVKFRAVVGHSSGEIAAAYAAGILPRANDAIRIAYYRGLHTTKLKPDQGAMLAAGLSFEDATTLCSKPDFSGRVVVAADNSSTSVTLSGDVDAIDQLKAQLDAEGTFNRKLRVDMAYHSHHMNACADDYLASIRTCDIKVQQPPDGCVWVSSVRGDIDSVIAEDDEEYLEAVRDQYWVDNLTNPVLFGPAVDTALWRGGPFDAVVEIGPHPALKGPATQIFKGSLGSSLPYIGIMQRGSDEVEAFSTGLGSLWEHFGPEALINFDRYRKASFPIDESPNPPRLLKGLPSYAWDHTKVHWRESRASRNFRLADRPCHDLLGRRVPDDSPGIIRWRNILRPDDIAWVKGHVFQGQVVLPGVSYIAAVTEAVKTLAEGYGSSIKLLDLRDIVLHRAVVLQENRSCEFFTDLRLIHRGSDLVSAEFSFSTVQSDSESAPESTCSGRVDIHLIDNGGDVSGEAILPSQGQAPPNLSAVDVELFYSSLSKLGLAFSGPFNGIKSAKRAMGYAATSATWDSEGELGSSAGAYLLPPPVLDSALHALFAAFASPATEQMTTPYLPVTFRRVSIVPNDCPGSFVGSQISASVSANVTASSPKGLQGDVQVSFGESDRVSVLFEGVELRAVADQTSDRLLFSHTIWQRDISSGVDDEGLQKDNDDTRAIDALGRTALYYYRSLLEELSSAEIKAASWHNQMLVKSAEHWVEEVRTGRHPTIKPEWLNDTRETVWKQADKYQDRIDIELMRAVGENMPSIVRGTTQPLEVMMKDNMLTRFYIEGHGLDPLNNQIARVLSQLTHRYPQANVLEIGAGTGGTTRKILKTIGNAYSHYTFTDISPGFFERAADKFAEPVRQHKMNFKVLDIEKDIVTQGFVEGSYDIIIAANVIHATQYLEDTMRQVRRLLKPGGYLVMMEVTGDLLRLGSILGVLSGWWLGPQVGDEDRQWGPGISTSQWDDLLRRTGFGGVDHSALDSAESRYHYLSMMVTQAVDDRVQQLRSPLTHLSTLPALSDVSRVLLVGGKTPQVAHLAESLQKQLAPWAGNQIEILSNVDELDSNPAKRVSAIFLAELDETLFGYGKMTAERLSRLQNFFQSARSVLWVTAGARGPSPTANMFSGMARAIRSEQPDINLQLLDIGPSVLVDSPVIAEAFIRLALSDQKDFDGSTTNNPLLWSTETELALDNGTLLIPRLIPDGAQNERYNAVRRTVTKQLDAEVDADWELEVESADGTLSLTGVESKFSRRIALARARNSTSVGQVSINIELSVALTQPEHECFLSYGSVSGDIGRPKVITVTQFNKSVTISSADRTFNVDKLNQTRAPELLEALAGQMIARSLASRLPRRGSILLYEPAEQFVRAMRGCQLWNGRQIYCAASASSPSVPKDWILIDPRALDSRIRQALPADLAGMVDFASEGSGKRDITSCLPKNCVSVRVEPGFIDSDKEALGLAYTDASAMINSGTKHKVNMIARNNLTGRPSSSISYPAVLDWLHQGDEDIHSSVAMHVKPLDASGIFSSSKTHFMVGLSGDLGQSICGFMAQNGARHIAIASRSGQINPEWLESMHKQGVNVRMYKMDVTKVEDIRATITQIQSDGMPPIGGVANGSLLLRDKLFLNMDIDSMHDTFGSKVDGSRYLDQFFDNEKPLDYFVLFSSLATVGGNAGQSAYHAANMFMASLASNRRAKGMAGSVMHVAVVADAGYVTRQSGQLLEHLRKQYFMPTSETDAHQLFAEAVLASPADSGLHADICMGLQPFPDRPGDADLVRPSWFRDPRLKHFVFIQPDEDDKVAAGGADGSNSLPLTQRIDNTDSVEEAVTTVEEAFSKKLEILMQLDAGSVDVHSPPLKLGFDSLLAVEARGWFLKQMSVDVPVLRFLGDDSIHDICADAAAQYLAARGSSSGSASGDGTDTNVPTKSSSEIGEAASPPSPASLTSPASVEDLKGAAESTESKVATKTVTPPSTRNTSRIEKLSYLQSRLWHLGRDLAGATSTNITVSYTINGPLDATKLHQAVLKVVSHHPSLRTCFYRDEETNEPVQGLLRQLPPSPWLFKHVRTVTRKNGVLTEEFRKLKNHRWDLTIAETFGSTLVYIEDEDVNVLIFGYPLLVMDGSSWAIFLRDLGQAYSMQPLNRSVKLAMDAAIEQRQAVESNSPAMRDAFAFWEKVYADLPEPLPFLPGARTTERQPLAVYDVHRVIHDMDVSFMGKIKKACKELAVTPFHFHLATTQAMFAKLSPEISELNIGIFDANRPDDGSLEDTTGYFVNVIPMRFKLNNKEQAPFADIVKRTRVHALEARRHSHVPFDVLLERLNVAHDPATPPLHQVAVNYRIGSMAFVPLDGDKTRLAVDDTFSDAQNRYDFSFGFYENPDGSAAVHITCKDYIYDQAATEFLMGVYVHLLHELVEDASRPIPEYSLSPDAMKYLEAVKLGEKA